MPDVAADGAADRGDAAEPASAADRGDAAEPADGAEPIVDLGWAMIALCDQVARSLELAPGSGAE